MNPEFPEWLRCPVSGQRLVVESPACVCDQIETGWMISQDGQHRYPIQQGIPRFVPSSNYADSFGMQWNHFRQTQLDSYSGQPVSADRFWKATGWTPSDLAGQWILDAGCGAGRFAEVALQAGANVVALDYSSAIEACWANLRHHPRLHVVQGDLLALPLARDSFDFVYSLGVLQHTPDVARAFAALPPMLKSGGRLCADFYERTWKALLQPKYWLRPLTTRVPPVTLFGWLQRLVPSLLKMSRLFGKVPVAGVVLKRLIPVASYDGVLPLTRKQLEEWALLDTFDWFSPTFDYPQTAETVHAWMERAEMADFEVVRAGHLVVRGCRGPDSRAT
jgi:2-polyprenyl-3-methyl-5-hydroxy-6-metoxy-1,4-benzoquinol methylase